MDFVSALKSMLDYQKEAFNTGFNTILIFQGRMEKLTADMFEKSAIPKEVTETFENILSEYKKNQGNLKKLMEDSFNKFETILVSKKEDSHTPASKKSHEEAPVK